MAAFELTVVIPTFNERQNVLTLLSKLEDALAGIEWEAIYVDDHSPDGTSHLLRETARANRRVRLIERVGRRGLSSACIEGMMASAAPFIAVMDADMQHDETVLPAMLRKLKAEKLDLVVASRHIAGGSMGKLPVRRIRLSRLGASMSRLICRCDVSDVMSGFFLLDATFLYSVVPRLTGSGFKILVDLLASSQTPPKIGEISYVFRNRLFGESKLDVNVEIEYLLLIVDKFTGNWLPTRFVFFLFVGLVGVLVHTTILALLYLNHILTFAHAQVVSTWMTMTFNFFLNNLVTFRDRRLFGKGLAIGLLKFYGACSLGAVSNVAFANMLIHHHVRWYIAGVAGTVISSVWNYSVNTVFTWRQIRSS